MSFNKIMAVYVVPGLLLFFLYISVDDDRYLGQIVDYLLRIYGSFLGISIYYLFIDPSRKNTNSDGG